MENHRNMWFQFFKQITTAKITFSNVFRIKAIKSIFPQKKQITELVSFLPESKICFAASVYSD